MQFVLQFASSKWDISKTVHPALNKPFRLHLVCSETISPKVKVLYYFIFHVVHSFWWIVFRLIKASLIGDLGIVAVRANILLFPCGFPTTFIWYSLQRTVIFQLWRVISNVSDKTNINYAFDCDSNHSIRKRFNLNGSRWMWTKVFINGKWFAKCIWTFSPICSKVELESSSFSQKC